MGEFSEVALELPRSCLCVGFSRSQKTFPGRVRLKFAQNEGHEKATKKPRKNHEKATKNAQTLFFQADEGHEKATEKPRKSHEKVTSKNVTSNEKSSEDLTAPESRDAIANFHRRPEIPDNPYSLNLGGGGSPP